jgi:hypothetical protein
MAMAEKRTGLDESGRSSGDYMEDWGLGAGYNVGERTELDEE